MQIAVHGGRRAEGEVVLQGSKNAALPMLAASIPVSYTHLTFSCPGYKVVEDRRIRCHKTTGHGAETFEQGIMNSCNPVFKML